MPLTQYFFDGLVLAAALISCARFGRISSEYYPFIFLVWLSVLQAFFFPSRVFSAPETWNKMSFLPLLNLLLITWQFSRWKHWRRTTNAVALILLSSIYLLLYFFWNESLVAALFWMLASLLICFASINVISPLLLRSGLSLLRSPRFVISATFLIYFTSIAVSSALSLSGLASGLTAGPLYVVFGGLQVLGGLSGCWVLLMLPRKKETLL